MFRYMETESTESLHAAEDFSNPENQGVMERNPSANIGGSIQGLSSPELEEREIGMTERGETSKKGLSPVVDSLVDGQHESEISNIENGSRLMQLPESLMDTINDNDLDTHASQTGKEESPGIYALQPLVDESQEFDEHRVTKGLKSDSNSDSTVFHDTHSEESESGASKQEEKPLPNGPAGLIEGPKKFHKNLSYHGTGRLPCQALGDGWTIEQIVRQQGKSAGRYDTYYYSPLGAKIRSKLKLREFVNVDLTNFDYNSGKFIESGNVVISPKPKMSLLKTEELKTINRSTDKNTNSSLSKQSKKLLIKLPPRKKLFPAICYSAPEKKKLPKKARKRKSPSSTFVKHDVVMDDDSCQNNPFEVFKTKALSLSSHFEDMKDYIDLIQFAWNFLSIESKTRFNDMFAAENLKEPRHRSRREKLNCQSSSYDRLPGESQAKQSRLGSSFDSSGLDPVMGGHDTSTGASDSGISQNPLVNHSHTCTDIPTIPQNSVCDDSIVASRSSHHVFHANQEGTSLSDNKGAYHSQAGPREFKLTQKPHKRKSRVPVYIKQNSDGNEV